MSTVQEIEAAIPQLPHHEIEQLKSWFDDFYEDRLELADEVKARLNEARADIAAGRLVDSPRRARYTPKHAIDHRDSGRTGRTP